MTQSRRIKNRRGKKSVNCIVSDRYLKFMDLADSNTAEGAVVTIQVMVDKYGDGSDRRLCELVLPVEELRAALANIESKTC